MGGVEAEAEGGGRDGGLKDMMGQVTMLAMHGGGLIILPPPRWKQNPPRPIVFGPDTEPPSATTYLGYKALVGAQMRYAVHDRNGLPLAMLGFSTAAWALAPGDRFNGWTPALRSRKLPLVIDNPGS